jgi:hypothetical protein
MSCFLQIFLIGFHTLYFSASFFLSVLISFDLFYFTRLLDEASAIYGSCSSQGVGDGRFSYVAVYIPKKTKLSCLVVTESSWSISNCCSSSSESV